MIQIQPITPVWKLFLARSSDMSIIRPLLTARNRIFKFALNKPGSASFTLNSTERAAQDVSALTTCLLAYRNNKSVWSGPVWTIDDKLPDVTFNCVGWFEKLNNRTLKCGPQAPPSMPTSSATTHVYSHVDAGAIVLDLLQRTNLEGNSRITVGRYDVSNVRNITYQIYQNVGQAITSMSNIEGGFDFNVTPDTRALDIYYGTVKAGSTIFGRGVNRPEVYFGYGCGPSNLVDISRQIDGSKTMNQMAATGRYGVALANDTVSQGLYDMFQANESLADVVDINILLAYANAEVAVRAQPMTIYSLTPMPSGWPRTPQPFDSYDLGDIVYFSSNYGRMKVGLTTPQGLRVFGFDINVEDNGMERVGAIQGTFS